MLSELRAQLEALSEKATGSGRWAMRRVMDKTFRVRTEDGTLVANVPHEQDAALIVALVNNRKRLISALEAAEAVEVAREALSDAALALEEIGDAIWPDVGDSKGMDRVQAFARQALAALEPKP